MGLTKNQIFIAQGFEKCKKTKMGFIELLIKLKKEKKRNMKKVYPLLLGGERRVRNESRSH